MKRCFKCGERKPLTEFYRHAAMGDGRLGKCKECAKADTIRNRQEKIDYYREYDRARASMPHRVAARREYRKTAAGRAATIRAHRNYWANHPERRAAHTALGNAVRDGRVIPWPVCAVPGCSSKPEAHHPDYSAPLDVVWLCSAHHKQAHALARKAA